jgi:hypothetical protein
MSRGPWDDTSAAACLGVEIDYRLGGQIAPQEIFGCDFLVRAPEAFDFVGVAGFKQADQFHKRQNGFAGFDQYTQIKSAGYPAT